jgi:hypothetical protein
MAPVVAWAAAGLGVAQGTLGYALLQIGGSLVLSAASKALMPKPDTGVQGRTITVRQPVAPRHVVYGQARKGGTIIYADTSRNGGKSLDLIIALAGHRVKEIGAVYFDGKLAFRAGTIYPEPWIQSAAGLERLNGDANQTGSGYLKALSPTLWTAAHRLRGIAAVMVTLNFSTDVFPRGLPNITVDIKGRDEIYDPRTAARGYSENAALCLADYLAEPTWGLNAAIGAEDGTNTAQLIAAANICDEVLLKAAGGTERRYTCNGVITLDQTPKSIVEAMLTSMAGNAVWQAGQWYIQPGAYIPPALSFSADDVAGDGFTLQTRVSRSENFNGVRGQFVSPENDWQPDDFPAYASAAYLAEDGGERVWSDITLPFTISSSAAQRLAKIHLERQRRQMSVGMTGKLSTWRATVGDTVNLDYARWGFAAKPFEVRNISLGVQGGEAPYLAPEFVLRETSPLVFDWSASEEQIYAAAPRTTLPSSTDIEPPGGLTVTEGLYQTLTGSGVKAKAIIDWTASPTSSVTDYRIEGRIGVAPWQVLGRTNVLTFDVLDIAPGAWEFQVIAISRIGAESPPVAVPQTIYGLSAPPAAMGPIILQAAGGTAILKWQLHPDLDVRIGGIIEVRHSAALSPAWTNSVSMDLVAGSQTSAAVPLKPGTYLVRAVDQSGIPGPVSAIPASGAQAVGFVALTTLTEETAFSGTKSGTVAVSGALTLDSSSVIDSWASFDAIANIDAEGGILPNGSYNFATGIDFGSVKNARLRSEIDLVVNDLATTIDTRPGDIGTWASFDGADGGEVDVIVEVRTTLNDPAASPTWSAWGRADNTEVQARGVQARALLSTADPNFSPSVTKLRLNADEVI